MSEWVSEIHRFQVKVVLAVALGGLFMAVLDSYPNSVLGAHSAFLSLPSTFAPASYKCATSIYLCHQV